MIKRNPIAATGIDVSCIGLGTVKFGRNQSVKYPTQFELPSDKQIIELLACAKSLGINLLDTAPAYGISEERLGKVLGAGRKDWVICTKVGEEFVDGQSSFDFSPAAVERSVERSLRRLNTDFLDIVLVHSNGDDKKIIAEDAVFVTLKKLQEKGYFRTFGMSTKTIEGGLLTVDHADIVMATYNPVETSDKPILDYAYKHNKAVFIKKALASGHLQKIHAENPVKHAMEFIFAEPGVTSVILGTLSPEHLQQNVDSL